MLGGRNTFYGRRATAGFNTRIVIVWDFSERSLNGWKSKRNCAINLWLMIVGCHD